MLIKQNTMNKKSVINTDKSKYNTGVQVTWVPEGTQLLYLMLHVLCRWWMAHLRRLKFRNKIQCSLALYPYTRFPVCLVCNGTSTRTEPFIWVLWFIFSYLYLESNSAVLLGQKTSKNRWWCNLKYRRQPTYQNWQIEITDRFTGFCFL
jgi:hypothetical protein